MKKVVVTGSEGFIGGYVVKELLSKGYFVVGIDNFSKYGPIERDHSSNKNFKLKSWDSFLITYPFSKCSNFHLQIHFY